MEKPRCDHCLRFIKIIETPFVLILKNNNDRIVRTIALLDFVWHNKFNINEKSNVSFSIVIGLIIVFCKCSDWLL